MVNQVTINVKDICVKRGYGRKIDPNTRTILEHIPLDIIVSDERIRDYIEHRANERAGNKKQRLSFAAGILFTLVFNTLHRDIMKEHNDIRSLGGPRFHCLLCMYVVTLLDKGAITQSNILRYYKVFGSGKLGKLNIERHLQALCRLGYIEILDERRIYIRTGITPEKKKNYNIKKFYGITKKGRMILKPVLARYEELHKKMTGQLFEHDMEMLNAIKSGFNLDI